MADEITEADENSVLAAMMFLAALAYPESHAARNRAVSAMLARVKRDARAVDHPAGRSEDARQLFAQVKRQQQRNTLRQTGKRLQRRFLQAEIASQLLMGMRRVISHKKIPPEVQKFTRDKLMREHDFGMDQALRMTAQTWPVMGSPVSLNTYARPNGGLTAFRRDVWRPEVVHLALAFRVATMKWEREHGRALVNFLELVIEPDWITGALKSAEAKLDILRTARGLHPAFARVRSIRAIRLVPPHC